MTTFNTGNRKITRFALPLAFVFAYIVESIDFLRLIAYMFPVLPLHEMGHAIMSWMGGRWAVPVIGMTLISYSRSYFFIFLFFTLLLFGIYYFYKKKYKFHLIILFLIFFASLFLTFKVDEMRLSSFISLAGIMGEIVLSTLLIISFYYNLTERFRWDFWRFGFLILGAVGFTNTARQWYKIKTHVWPLPLGSAMSVDEMSGDLTKLILAGWSEAQIIMIYWSLIKACMIVISLHYIAGLLNQEACEMSVKQETD